MFGVGVVRTAKGDLPDHVWNALFWGCLHRPECLHRSNEGCLGLLTQPKAITAIVFGAYCVGVAKTATGDYLHLFGMHCFGGC